MVWWQWQAQRWPQRRHLAWATKGKAGPCVHPQGWSTALGGLIQPFGPDGWQRLGDSGPASQPAVCPGPAQLLSLSPTSSSIK